MWAQNVSLLIFPFFALLSLLYWLLENPIRLFRRHQATKSGLKVAVRPILARFKLFIFDDNRRGYFLSGHGSFEEMSFLLKSNLILIDMTKDEAIFGLLPKPLHDYQACDQSWLFLRGFSDITALVRVNLSDLIEFGDKLGSLEPDLCIISNTGRCGSTLVVRQLHALVEGKESLVLSENGDCEILERVLRTNTKTPEVIPPSSVPRVDACVLKELGPVIRAVFTVQYNGRGLKKLIIKPRFCSIRIVPHIYRAFPGKVKEMFVERRNVWKTLESSTRFFGLTGQIRLAAFVSQFLWQIKKRIIPKPPRRGRLHFNITRLLARTKVLSASDEILDLGDDLLLPSILEFFAAFIADTIVSYHRALPELGSDSLHFYYEDVVGANEVELGRMAGHVGVGAGRVGRAAGLLGEHSQESHPEYRAFAALFTPVRPTPRQVKRVDAFFAALHLPPVQWPDQPTSVQTI